MKKKSLLLVLCAFYACMSYAYNFEEGGIYYNITSSSNMTVSVTSGTEKYKGMYTIPEYVIHEGETYYVTAIGSYAFSGCTDLSSVSFDSNSCVSSIGNSAFSGCNGIGSISIPASVTSIESYAFSGCKTLRTVIIEDSKTPLSLGWGSMKGSSYPLFADCPLTTFYWGRPLSYSTNYGTSPISNQFSLNKLTIGPNVTTISAYMFSGNPKTTIELPETVTALGDHAFDGFTNLTSFTIPKNITSIGEYAFANCTGLTSLTIPTWISTINAGTFQNCTGLKSIVIPNNVTSIGNFAFNGCTSMTGVVFEEGDEVLTLGNHTYASSAEGKGLFYDCPLQSAYIGRPLSYNSTYWYGYSPFAKNGTLTEAHFGNPVKAIQSYLFYGCKSLKSLQYKSNCSPSSIESYAFSGCTSLTESDVVYPTSVQNIGEGAFSGCTSLEGYTIPNHVKTVGDYVFQNCEKMKAVVVKPSVKSIGNGVFNGCTAMTGVVFEDGDEVLTLGYNTYASSAEGKGLFYDCPLQSTYIGRPLSYNSTYWYGYSPFARNEALTEAKFGEHVKAIQSYLFYGCKLLKTLKYNTNCAPTSVESYAFCGCTSLTESDVVYPTSVQTIGEGAFSNCTSLEGYTIPNHVKTVGDYAFQNCEKMKAVVIKPSVKSIGSGVFNGCTAMTGLVFEESDEVLTLGYNTYASSAEGKGLFYDCPLQSTFIGRPLSYNSTYWYGYSPFAKNETLTGAKFGNPLKAIPSYLFYGCKSLKTLEYNPNCAPTSIESYAFSGCTSLTMTDVVYPTSVQTIGEGAFSGCTSIEGHTFTIPNHVKTVGDYAFQNCEKIKSVVVKPSVKSIGNGVFNGCTAMTGVVFEDGDEVLTLGYNTYASSAEGKGLFYDCPLQSTYIGRPLSYNSTYWYGYSPFAKSETLTGLHFGEHVKAIPDYLCYGDKKLDDIVYNEKCQLESIGKYAFGGCKSLPTQQLHNTITVINEGAFSNCILFADFDLPEKLATIGSHAFENCTGLTKLTIPATVTSIGNYAYDGCDGITSVTVKWTKPISIYSETFSNRTNAVLEVPHGSVAAYKAANYWKEFEMIIEAGEDPISVLKGDMDGDGVLDVNDVQMLINVILGRK